MTKKKFKRFEYLDALRGLAILLVIVYHAGNVTGYKTFEFFNSTYLEINNIFQYGVQLFFVVSAFTLMMSYDNRKEEKQATKKFFIRRFFRIAPMWYIAIAYTTLIILDFNFSNFDWNNFPKKAFLGDLLFFNSLVPSTINSYVQGGWSISNEFLFYFCMPLICSKIKSLNGFITFTVLTIMLCGFLLSVLSETAVDTNNYLLYYFFNQIPVFSLGLLAYWVGKAESISEVKPKVILLLIAGVCYFTVVDFPFPILVSIIFFLLIIMLGKKPYTIISNKVLAKIGEVSFSMYLMHFVVMYMMDWWGYHNLLAKIVDLPSAVMYYSFTIFLLFAPSFLVSCLTYKYIEQKGQNIGRSIIKKMN